MRKDIALARVCLVNYLFLAPLEAHYTDVLEKTMPFLTLYLTKILITSEKNFRRSLCGMVVKNKVKK